MPGAASGDRVAGADRSERLCPSCGASNPAWVSRCTQCQTDLAAVGPMPAANPRGDGRGSAPGGSARWAPRRRERAALAAIAATAVIVVALVLLDPGLLHPAAGAAGPETFDEARIQAIDLAQGLGNGTWYLNEAGGSNGRGTGGAATCGTNLTIPAFGGNLSSGRLVFWTFTFWKNATGGIDQLYVYLVNGQVEATCYGFVAHALAGALWLDLVAPAAVIDTAAVAPSALSDGGYAYLRGDPNASESMFLSAEPMGVFSWTVTYGYCGPEYGPGPTGNHPIETVDLNATSGALEGANAGSEAC